MPAILRPILLLAALCLACACSAAEAQAIDVPTRPGVTQRFLYLPVENPAAALILFAGGNGGLQLGEDGTMRSLKGNFLVRSRELFAKAGFAVAVIDAPSDLQGGRFLAGRRESAEHVADVAAVIAWMRRLGKPVWLVGTSRGTQSAAYVATQLTPQAGGPDGIVLTSSLLSDRQELPIPALALDRITVPVLVVHHEEDGCAYCAYNAVPALMARLPAPPRSELVSMRGGFNVGDPCEARAYHGFNGIEAEVVTRIADWIRQH